MHRRVSSQLLMHTHAQESELTAADAACPPPQCDKQLDDSDFQCLKADQAPKLKTEVPMLLNS